jgi:hypothetical protein
MMRMIISLESGCVLFLLESLCNPVVDLSSCKSQI